MNFKNLFSFGVLALLLSACSEEPANMECDIERIWIHVDDPLSLFTPEHVEDTLKAEVKTKDVDRFITWNVKNGCAPSGYPVYFMTTPGASAYIYDANGTKRPFAQGEVVDFSNWKTTTIEIISEDRAWSKQYELSMVERPKSHPVFTFDFSGMKDDMGNYDMHKPIVGEPGTYYLFKPSDKRAIESLFYNPKDPYWKNGNPGFALSRSSAKPEKYPTFVGINEGPDGSDCVIMQTSSTGNMGAMANIYIAAGSLFNGSFDAEMALSSRTSARLATRFGTPFDRKPLSMTLDMKYVPGPNYWDEDKNVLAGIVDEPDAYVVFFRNNVPGGMLDGTNVLTHPNIIGKARIKHRYNADGTNQETGSPIHGITAEWQTFKLELEYTSEPDPEVLKNMGYSMIIGFSSSWQGADFRGALKSMLYIDNIIIECEQDPEE